MAVSIEFRMEDRLGHLESGFGQYVVSNRDRLKEDLRLTGFHGPEWKSSILTCREPLKPRFCALRDVSRGHPSG